MNLERVLSMKYIEFVKENEDIAVILHGGGTS